MSKRASLSKTFVWILLGLLILGLAGFGATNLGGTMRTVGQVGDKYLDVNEYARQFQQEMRAVSAQTGQPLPVAQALEIGLDQAVLRRMVRNRALDHEADQMGLSIGDENLRSQILEIQAFQGVDGQFDRDGYRFALEQANLTEADFETSLREESARTLLQGAMVNGATMPETFANVLLEFAGERRSFEWARLDRDDLDTPQAAPTETELKDYYDANLDAFMLPETKKITYALLTPDMILDQLDIDEAELRKQYQARINEFNQPERRLVERLVYGTEEDAESAAALLEVSGTTFENLVTDRGLTLSDVDLGDVGRLELDAAGEAVFGAEVGDVVGPLPSAVGPALFRVNGILPAQSVSFEDAREVLQNEVSADRARRLIETQSQEFEDLMAAGATLEELAAETDMQLGTLDWTASSDQDVAAYAGFRDAAAAATPEDFPQIAFLDDGSAFALRVDEVLAPRPAPLAEARGEVRTAWETAQIEARLMEQAEALLAQITPDTDLSELGLDVIGEDDQTRNAFINGTPPSFMTEVFGMEVGETKALPNNGSVVLVRLGRIAPPEENSETAQIRASIREQLNQAVAQDLFDIYTRDVTLRARPQVDQRAIQAVNASFQ